MRCDHATAVRRLTNRWNEQVKLYPTMRDKVPLSLYIRRNVRHVMAHDSLADYMNPVEG